MSKEFYKKPEPRPTYFISDDGQSITCRICGMESHNPNDVDNLFCGNCDAFHDDMCRPERPLAIQGTDLKRSSPEQEQALRQLFPAIQWREPVPVRVINGGQGLACRICIALHGLAAEDVHELPQTVTEFQKHMEECHP